VFLAEWDGLNQNNAAPAIKDAEPSAAIALRESAPPKGTNSLEIRSIPGCQQIWRYKWLDLLRCCCASSLFNALGTRAFYF
jgi:hypothetical protein